MLFLSKNLLQTTTEFFVPSNSLLAANILDRDETRQWISNGANIDGLTVVQIFIPFDETTTIDYIPILEMNWRNFEVLYDNGDGNSIPMPLTPGEATTVAAFTNNTQKSMVLPLQNVRATNITINAYSTIEPNNEKAVGYMALCQTLVDFERLPSYRDYDVLRRREEVVHRLSNGGTRINVKDQKFEASIKLKYVMDDFKAKLKEIHQTLDEFIFCGFPKTTNFDEVVFPCVWEGSFDFENFSNNAPDTGFDGIIKLKETP